MTKWPLDRDTAPVAQDYVESILDVLAVAPERHVITDANGRSTTAGALRDDVYRLAAELACQGIGRGSTVALMMGNSVESLSVRYAANLLGARVALLHEMIHKLVAPDVVARTVRRSVRLGAGQVRRKAPLL